MSTRKLTHWDHRFLDLSRFIAEWSKDPSTQVGCVIVDHHNRIVSTGFNGLASGVEDTIERLENRDIKYRMVVHAERNAIIDAKRDLSDLRLYCSLIPCSECAAMIIQAGISEVIAPENTNERLAESCRFDLTEVMFEEAGVTMTIVSNAAVDS